MQSFQVIAPNVKAAIHGVRALMGTTCGDTRERARHGDEHYYQVELWNGALIDVTIEWHSKVQITPHN